MKRITLLWVMIATFVGCQENIEIIVLPEETQIFEAIAEGFEANTKTSIDNQKNIRWSENDQLAIFQGCSFADKYQVTAETVGTGNGIFELIADNSGDVNGNFNSGVEIATNIALYPYADGLSVTNIKVTDGKNVAAYEVAGLVLPETQHYAANSFSENSFPMVAVTETMSDHTLRFKNVMGAIKLQLKGSQTVKSITIKGNNNEKLSGAATVTTYFDGKAPVLRMSDNALTYVTLDCGNSGVVLSKFLATDFIITLPPLLFSLGFTVEVTYLDKTTKTIETTSANTILRSSMLVMPILVLDDEITEDGEEDDVETSVESVTLDKTSIILAPNTSYSLIAKVVPTNATHKTLTWSSYDAAVATVDQSGVITAISDGTTTITAVAVGGASKSCTVKVVSLLVSEATNDYVDEYSINHGKGIVLGATVWAPVNCGYKVASDTDKGFPYGKLYQWGRKYGQGYSTNYDSSAPIIEEGPVSEAYGQTEEKADFFFTSTSYPYDWSSVADEFKWNSGSALSPLKAAMDPCPDGWRIPTKRELSALQTEYSDWTRDENGLRGRYFSGVSETKYDTPPLGDNISQVFLPAAGYHFWSGGCNSRNVYGIYWSSSWTVSYAHNLVFRDSSVTIDVDKRGRGCSVRCVQE